MKATEHYFPVILYMALYKVVLTFEFVDEIRKFAQSSERYWGVLSNINVYYSVQGVSNPSHSSDFVNATLTRYHSNESFWAILSYDTSYYVVQGGSSFWEKRPQ